MEPVATHTGEIWEAVLRFLSQRSTLTLATADEAGQPYAASLYFVHDDGLRLYFFSSPESRHTRHLLNRPEVAVTIHGEPWDWRTIQGLQLTGRADPAHARLYRITPRWVRWIDNTRGFGYRVEWRLG
jgi:uncharacterized protein YhbP (UPF0306 family)